MGGPVKIGLIGAGWGRYHVRSYLEDRERIAVAAIADLDEERLRRVTELSRAAGAEPPRCYTDYRTLLEREDLTIVVIALPNFLHAPVAVDCLRAGKHALVEKPPSNSVEGAQHIVEAVRETGSRCMIGVTNRFRPETQRLKAIIERGDLGEIYYGKTGWLRRRGIPVGSSAGWFLDRKRAGGGALIDIGVHVLDLTWWLMGSPKPAAIAGVAYDHFIKGLSDVKADVEDFAAGLIRFTNGASLAIEASWASHIDHDRGYSRILGTAAGLDMDLRALGERQPLCIYTEKDGDWFDINLPQYERVDWEGALRSQLLYFAECIREGRDNMANAEHGLELMRMLCGLYESANAGREVLLVP